MSSKLALEGGQPARSRPDTWRVVRIGGNQISTQESESIAELLLSSSLYRYHGRAVSQFETEFSRWLNAESPTRCLAVNSGTSALLLALAALDLCPGDEVLIPMIGFVSAATAIIAAGAVPRFVPVDRTLCMDPEKAIREIRPATRALLAVHAFGSACNIDRLQEITQSFSGTLIEDAAQACGTKYRNRRVGSFGRMSCFSFQDFKVITTGEGGMVVTPDQTLFDTVTFMHDAAATWTVPDRAVNVKTVKMPPMNFRMSEVEGRIGLEQLSKCNITISRLQGIHDRFANYLGTRQEIILRPHNDPVGAIGSNLIFYFRDKKTAEWAVAALRAEGVGIGLLIGQAGSNRHWARDWGPILKRCGYGLSIDAETCDTQVGLSAGVNIPIDIRYSSQDVEETLLAFSKVLDAVRS
jgi:dTDP-4-amino-4,6-dideoxygalactose transaminase